MIDIEGLKTYSNCVSLGFNCGTASSLSRLGLRSCSGPFDWYVSNYQGVLKQIATNFRDFMNSDNLEVDPNDERGRVFIDRKYNFIFPHEIQSSLMADYDKIHSKYMRRIAKFSELVMQPTVFFRCIWDEDEIHYINENWEYAQNLLKEFNSDNHIIYTYRKGLGGLTEKVQSYVLGIDDYVGEHWEQRRMFESSSDLAELCSSLLPVEDIRKNISFDKHKRQIENSSIVDKCVREGIDGIDRIILKSLGASRSTGIYLWGAGTYGLRLAKYLQERKVRINGIIDNNLSGNVIDGFHIYAFEDVGDGVKIFVSVSKKEANESIVGQIGSLHSLSTVVRYQDLCISDFERLIQGWGHI